MEPDLGRTVEQRLDEPGAQPLVRLCGGPVELVRVIGHQEERGRRIAAPLVGEDAVEAPERVGSAHLVDRPAGQRPCLAQAERPRPREQVGLRARSSAAKPGRGPLPRRVDVVGERDGEAGAAPARRLDAEPRAAGARAAGRAGRARNRPPGTGRARHVRRRAPRRGRGGRTPRRARRPRAAPPARPAPRPRPGRARRPRTRRRGPRSCREPSGPSARPLLGSARHSLARF